MQTYVIGPADESAQVRRHFLLVRLLPVAIQQFPGKGKGSPHQ